MKAFAHYNATSVDHALDLLATHNGNACLNAGGTDLLGVLKDEILADAPEVVINIKSIPGLDTIEENEKELSIGALTKLSRVVDSSAVQDDFPLLAWAAQSVATPEIRNMATVGGNLCQDTRCWYYRYPHSMGGRIQCRRKGKGPCLAIKGDHRYHTIFGGKKCIAVCPSDMAVALAALDASVDITGPSGKRSIPVSDLYHSLGHTLNPDELVIRLRMPQTNAMHKQAFIKFRVRESVDFAIASVACVLDIDQDICRRARIVLGAVAPAPWRAGEAEAELIGKVITPDIASAAAEAATAGAKPMRRNAFKVELVKTLVQRAILEALEHEQ
jgi:xanthine dehydrogenase YagS FAD-binding subunit